jgi:hypothetical protein
MTDPKQLLSRERQITPATAAVGLACSLTGVATWLLGGHSAWIQWSVLFHLLTGVGLTLLVLIYCYLHFRRTIGVRRATVLISGLVSLPLLIAFLGSGWRMLLVGQRESEHWVYLTHVISSLALVSVVALHVILHFWLLPERRRKRENESAALLPSKLWTSVLAFNLAVQVVILVATAIYNASQPPPDTSPAVADYEYSYGPHPFRPSQTETSHDGFVEPREIAESHRCATCHPDVAAQWIASAHREAASDQAYVTNVSLLAEKKGISATRYCEGCHGPVALLTGELSPGGVHAGISGSLGNLEGVPCMGCHGIASLVHLKGVASYEFAPATEHLFARSDGWLPTRLHNWLLRVRPDQHRREVGRDLLSDPKVCAACHTQFMDKDMNGWGWVKMQDDYGAWLESPFSKQQEEDLANETSSRCQDCHMPLVQSNDPSADDEGMVRSHTFPGANTFLPILRGDHEHLEHTRSFLRSNRLRISIDPPSRADAVQDLRALDEELRDFEESPYYYYLEEEAQIRVAVSNHGVGHAFPGGTIDINEAWVEFLVMDASGEVVFESGGIDASNNVDPNAHFYRSLPIDRSGSLVWRHDLFNMVGESFRRVVPPGKSDLAEYKFRVPAWAKSPLTLSATLKYRKLNDRYARWALKDRYVEIPAIDMARDSLTIPLRIRREADESGSASIGNPAPRQPAQQQRS